MTCFLCLLDTSYRAKTKVSCIFCCIKRETKTSSFPLFFCYIRYSRNTSLLSLFLHIGRNKDELFFSIYLVHQIVQRHMSPVFLFAFKERQKGVLFLCLSDTSDRADTEVSCLFFCIQGKTKKSLFFLFI